MKQFKNKPIEMFDGNSDSKEQLGFIDLAIKGLNNIPQEGLTPSEMRDRLKIIDKIDSVKIDEEVELEDAEFRKIYDTYKGIKWLMMHKDIVAFDDYLEELNK